MNKEACVGWVFRFKDSVSGNQLFLQVIGAPSHAFHLLAFENMG